MLVKVIHLTLLHIILESYLQKEIMKEFTKYTHNLMESRKQ